MNAVNYQKQLEKRLENPQERGKRLLLHSCCAPCSSYCMEYLREFYRITVFYYNPNITEEPEYVKRVEEEKRLVAVYNRQFETGDFAGMHSTPGAFRIEVLEGDYEPQLFFGRVKGLEGCAEGGERCFACYALRLKKTAEVAKESGFDYFATTLTLSPLKNAQKLNEIGAALAESVGVEYLPSDFKKKGGYQRSIELSKTFELYRQNYCGCVFSRNSN